MTYQQARTESERCLYCFDAPCVQACPTHIDIPTFISMIKSGNVRGAAEVVKSANAFANVCGKICPEEAFCQSVCTRAKQDEPIKIRELHFFATQHEVKNGYSPVKQFPTLETRVAVVGGGPAGFGCAFELRKLGHHVTLFEKDAIGGVPKKSIPSFRLAESELQSDVKFLSSFISIKKENIDDSRLNELKKEFDAIFIAVGLGKDRTLGIDGEKLKGIYPVLDFLEKAKSNQSQLTIGKKVVVVGGGNVSLDAAATAKRLGASEVVLLYRRSENEMRVWKSELQEARAQGVEMRFLTNPVKFIGNERVTGIECVRMQLSENKDESGRRIPIEIAGSEHVIEADTVVVAIGQVLDKNIFSHLKRTPRGYLAVNEHFQTSESGIFAGGDAINGEGTIVQSVAHGKQAAHSIHQYLSAKK